MNVEMILIDLWLRTSWVKKKDYWIIWNSRLIWSSPWLGTGLILCHRKVGCCPCLETFSRDDSLFVNKNEKFRSLRSFVSCSLSVSGWIWLLLIAIRSNPLRLRWWSTRLIRDLRMMSWKSDLSLSKAIDYVQIQSNRSPRGHRRPHFECFIIRPTFSRGLEEWYVEPR